MFTIFKIFIDFTKFYIKKIFEFYLQFIYDFNYILIYFFIYLYIKNK